LTGPACAALGADTLDKRTYLYRPPSLQPPSPWPLAPDTGPCPLATPTA